MLGMKTYPKQYIDGCRKKVDADVASFKKLVTVAGKQPAKDQQRVDNVIAAFEATFFNNMVLVLDQLFVHRLRTVEGKDGNALNEVRVLCSSIMQHDGVLTADPSIKLHPETSVLQLELGSKIALTRAAFVKLSSAFFTEIERKFR